MALAQSKIQILKYFRYNSIEKKNYSTIAKIVAASIAILLFPLTLIGIGIGLIGLSFSKTYHKLNSDIADLTQRPPLIALPPEINEQIFSYIGYDDLKKCAKVCRRWETFTTPFLSFQKGNFSLFYGLNQWTFPNEYFSMYKSSEINIGEIPSLPQNLNQIVQAPCPFFKGRKIFQTHRLFLFSSSINGKKINLTKIIKKISGYLSENIICQNFPETVPQKSYWALISPIISQSALTHAKTGLSYDYARPREIILPLLFDFIKERKNIEVLVRTEIAGQKQALYINLSSYDVSSIHVSDKKFEDLVETPKKTFLLPYIQPLQRGKKMSTVVIKRFE